MAEAIPSFSAQYIERLLECAICLDRFKSPKLLPCQHTFCCLCLVSLVDVRRNCLRCPSCRVIHKVPLKGAGGFPNNLTITALLDIPTRSDEINIDEPKTSTKPDELDSEGTEYLEKPCADCGSVAKVISCFHCERDLCPTCRQCHKQSSHDEVTGDLIQIRQKINKLTAGVQAFKGNMEKARRETEASKLFVRESIDQYCAELRQRGFEMVTALDKKCQDRLGSLKIKSDKIAKHLSEMESFHQMMSAKMRQPVSQVSDSDLHNIMNKCCVYLGRSPRIPVMAGQRVRRQSSVKLKGKRPPRSNSGNRSNIQRPSMRRLQSLPDMDGPEQPRKPEEGAHQTRRASAMPAIESVNRSVIDPSQESQSPPPTFTIGDASPVHETLSETLETDMPSPVANAPEEMDTTDGEQGAIIMGMDDEPIPERESNEPNIIVKAIIGKRGSRFWNPSSICISPLNSTIFVVDSYKNHVQILDIDGHFVTSFGTSGNNEGEFDYPSACICDRLGNFLVVDAFNHRVQILDKLGLFIGTFGRFGTENGCFEGPSGIAIDSKGYIYIADTNNLRIQVFDPMGGHVHTFGLPESLPQTFKGPRYTCIVISRTDDVFVSDSKNHCIHMFSYTGEYIKSIGKQGSGLGEFSCPRGLALDHNRQLLLVADRDNHRVQVFHQTGEFLYGFGSQGERAGQFHGPEGVAVAENGNIVVAECGGQRIQIFTYNTPA